jgi:hypothetical protein
VSRFCDLLESKSSKRLVVLHEFDSCLKLHSFPAASSSDGLSRSQELPRGTTATVRLGDRNLADIDAIAAHFRKGAANEIATLGRNDQRLLVCLGTQFVHANPMK